MECKIKHVKSLKNKGFMKQKIDTLFGTRKYDHPYDSKLSIEAAFFVIFDSDSCSLIPLSIPTRRAIYSEASENRADRELNLFGETVRLKPVANAESVGKMI